MSSSNAVSIHPYFKAHPGRLNEIKALLREFVARTSTEEKNLYYEFTINGEEIFCREAYIGAEGALSHLANVEVQLASMLKMADVARLEIHGPSEELEKLRGPLSQLNPAWFVLECGVQK